ncbi:hypothetical protein J2Y69_002987 [Microbacterium resistens]|uniref:Uncharacterized protein n=1 Tax=Microbacterium resistens TaxID=156977 RepID=A0ABU1SFH5_9MICO|nr:hypothetical protein [Microbacterium resistens]MDR6868371.1 hypothetical protein [Microbacterium resistens]
MKKFSTAFQVSALAAAMVLSAGFAAGPAFPDGGSSPGTPPDATDSSQTDETVVTRVDEVLSPAELQKIGATQSQADIDKIIAMASPTQNVQVLLDFDTMTYGGAVLVN